MPRTISSHILSAHSPKRRHFPSCEAYAHPQTRNTSRFAESCTKMGNLICMPSFSSRANTSAKISDSSIWSPQIEQHISIRTFRELNRAPTSSPTSTRTVIASNGASSRSTDVVLEAAARKLMTQPQRH
uniref:C4 n=1 Tax=Chayote yellow mosaic virus TaxID=222450 RepID=A0A189WH65_9GEMI|nr:C4 [Chayote yellow mosaic virus]ALO02569.1 C4 [Chayote yellow mosaic virus]ALO02575.1 C4 [Chayote yellow mosaic virus]ALO02581.1 C4 [Chayote yellow mosaic virus]ALO02599.1 C4 [Chayote yellow mosaic virus]